MSEGVYGYTSVSIQICCFKLCQHSVCFIVVYSRDMTWILMEKNCGIEPGHLKPKSLRLYLLFLIQQALALCLQPSWS